jgi:hypothetical protein
MTLELSAIYFDHDQLPAARKPAGSSPLSSALHIRRSQDYEVNWPEYEKGNLAQNPVSCAAYSISDTAGQAVFILAQFENLSSTHSTYEVKADGGGILGPINPTPVTFGAGEASVRLGLPLSGRTFEEVGKYSVAWQWYYREQGAAGWHSLAGTEHQVYLN